MADIQIRQKPFRKYCEGALATLAAQHEMIKILGHAATAGASREALVRNFLTDHLPELVTTVSGVIVDTKGNRSKQQDIVLMMKSMPRLRFASSDDLIFQEGAIATFEVKTAIRSRSVINEIGKNIASVMQLIPSSLAGTRMGNLDWPHGRILAAIVTYEGAQLSTVEKWLNDTPESNRPDIYLDLSSGILIGNRYIQVPAGKAGVHYTLIDDAAAGLAHFLTAIAKITSVFQTREVIWEDYMA